MESKTSKSKPKLIYKFSDKPHGYVSLDHLWGQDLRFRGEFTSKTKKDLMKKRTAVVRDVAKVFAKHGITTEDFNCMNEWI